MDELNSKSYNNEGNLKYRIKTPETVCEKSINTCRIVPLKLVDFVDKLWLLI